AAAAPRGGVTRGLDLEAALIAEAACGLQEATVTMVGSLDMDVDLPQLLTTELGGDGSISAPDPSD
ncbi:unnamed protein product, partial [Urochloa humidicola]